MRDTIPLEPPTDLAVPSEDTEPSVGTGLALLTAWAGLPDDLLGTVVAGVLSEHSRRAYLSDIRHFLGFLAEKDVALPEIRKPVLVAYRAFLARGYAPSTVNRRLTVARRLVSEAWELGYLAGAVRNPADGRGVAGLKDGGERGKPALTLEQASALIGTTRRSVDLPALRDAALLHLLVGTGLRRAEIAAALVGDLQRAQGHTVLVVTGKGNKRRQVKLTPAVLRDLVNWLSTADRLKVDNGGKWVNIRADAPLFSPVRKRGRGKEARWVALETPLSAWSVWSIVTTRIKGAGLEVNTTPHGLRATFITLALEAGATISKVQDAAGHRDPRTTDRYRRRRANLDDNAADYVQLDD